MQGIEHELRIEICAAEQRWQEYARNGTEAQANYWLSYKIGLMNALAALRGEIKA